MFLNTLDIKLGKIRKIAEKKRLSDCGICLDDKRGRHGHQKKTSTNQIDSIKNHIGLFPAYKSHYSRSHSDKKYLTSDLSISKMYRMYKEYCEEKQIQPTSESFYRKVFNENFNLSFHRPE